MTSDIPFSTDLLPWQIDIIKAFESGTPSLRVWGLRGGKRQVQQEIIKRMDMRGHQASVIIVDEIV